MITSEMMNQCTTCSKDGKYETLHHGPEFTTLMSVGEFTDKEGNEHIHNSNTHTAIHWCKNGHFFTSKVIKGCDVKGCLEHICKVSLDKEARTFLHRANDYLQCPHIYDKVVDLESLQKAVDIIISKNNT